jgi:hypothetical protein
MSAPTSAPGSGAATPIPANKHAQSATDRQRAQLERLLKDPAKPAHIPAPPKDKTLRPAREMMKNVQGSSAGAGSGEFHVYKASRRREYERLKMMEEESAQVCAYGVHSWISCSYCHRKRRRPSSRRGRWSGNSWPSRRRPKTAQNGTRRRYVV